MIRDTSLREVLRKRLAANGAENMVSKLLDDNTVNIEKAKCAHPEPG
jgi:hypothetical protein